MQDNLLLLLIFQNDSKCVLIGINHTFIIRNQ